MALKRVSKSYARRLSGSTVSHRNATVTGRTAKQPATPPPQVLPPLPAAAVESTAAVSSEKTNRANFSAFRANQVSAASRIAVVDYQGIIAAAVAGLSSSTVQSRHTIYECARQIVFQRLANIRPRLPAELIKLEQLSLDLAIKKIETDEARNRAAESPAVAAGHAPDAGVPPVAVARQHFDLPQAKQLRDGARRLFGVATVVIAISVGYGISTDKIDPALLKSPAAQEPSAQSVPLQRAQSAQLPYATAAPEFVSGSKGSELPAAARLQASVDPSLRSTALEASNVLAKHKLVSNLQPETASAASHSSVVLGVKVDDELLASLAGCRTLTDLDARALCVRADRITDANGFDAVANDRAPYWIAQSDDVALAAMRLRRPGRSPEVSPLTSVKVALLGVHAPQTANSAARQALENAVASASRGDSTSALQSLTEAIAIDPQFSEAYIRRGQIYSRRGNIESAIGDFDSALKIDARNPNAYRARAAAFVTKGEIDRAIIDLTRAIQFSELGPIQLADIDMFEAFRSRADLYEKKQLYGRELSDLSAMIDAYWKRPGLAEILKASYGERGAVALILSIYQRRAGVNVKLGNPDGAIADLSQALRLFSPDAGPLIVERARLLEAAGRRDDAAADYEHALRFSPENDEIKGALTRLRGLSNP
jgi:tetratricopeptide (TPR) repeat protein